MLLNEAAQLAMKIRGFTQVDLACASGISQGHVSRLLYKDELDEGTMLRLCEGLGISVRQLRQLARRFDGMSPKKAYKAWAGEIGLGYLKAL